MMQEFEKSPIHIFPLHENHTHAKYKNYTNSYIIQLLVTHSYFRLNSKISTHTCISILHHIMLNYQIIIKEFVFGMKKLHEIVEIWPIDIKCSLNTTICGYIEVENLWPKLYLKAEKRDHFNCKVKMAHTF